MTEPRRRGTAFRRVRIGVLLSVLIVVLLWAGNDLRRRRERTSWQRPLEVALIVLRRGPVDDAAVGALRARARDLESHLAAEMARHRGISEPRPFSFTIHGPIDVTAAPPAPTGETLTELGEHALRSWRYFRDVDDRAGVEWRAFDSRIYLVVRPPAVAAKKTVEGQSEQGGRIGSVEVELDQSMVDFALFVATHELFHTLGATDKYDAIGRARVPEGLADPERVPLYPQDAAEIMARNVVIGPNQERPPDTIAELRVGKATAREIAWIAGAP